MDNDLDLMPLSEMILPELRDLEGIPDAPAMEELGPYSQEVFDAICSGWSNGMVVTYLRDRHEFTPPMEVIQQYRETVPLELILPSTALQRHFHGLRVMVDPLVEMQMILRLEHERLSYEMEQEQLARDGFNPRVDVRKNAYWKHLKEFAELVQAETGHVSGETTINVLNVGDLFDDLEVRESRMNRRRTHEIESQRLQADERLSSPPLLEG
jgi:hypothetical protein